MVTCAFASLHHADDTAITAVKQLVPNTMSGWNVLCTWRECWVGWRERKDLCSFSADGLMVLDGADVRNTAMLSFPTGVAKFFMPKLHGTLCAALTLGYRVINQGGSMTRVGVL
ncbi:unnamed protein product [Ectocarpus sp. 13 AM-2016]